MPTETGQVANADAVAQYAALQATVAGLADQLDRMRRDLAPLIALPTSLQAVTELHAERMANLRQTCEKDTDSVRAELAAVRAELESVQGWQTWAMRLVIGAVVTAVLALVLARPVVG